jgi:TM2 domain-containing membrane protein YozV
MSTQESANPPRSVVSSDAKAMMMFEANKKSTGVAYLLWFFLGMFGGHRFYLGQTGTAICQLCLCIAGIVLAFVIIGYFLLIALWIWWIVDAFLIPGIIRNLNTQLATQLGAA